MTPDAARNKPVPLCVDLDGALIKTDLLWESLVLLARRNPLWLVAALFWWMRGRAFLKQKLAARVQVDAAALPYNESFLEFLRAEKKKGRKLILATASDRKMAKPVFDHVHLFDELLASDGKMNLRGAAKLKTLTERFGERGFDYAGNSSVDLGVWPGAREAIVVNAGRELVERAAKQTKLGPTFTDDYSPFFALKRYLNELFIRSHFLLAALGGLLLAGAFPNVGIAGLAWVAPALILAAAYGKRGSETFWIGYVAGLAHWLASLYWLLLIPVTGYPILGWVALCAYLALFPAVWVWLVARVPGSGFRVPGLGDSWAQRTFWALFGAAAWVALEMIRARFLSGFPWIPVGAAQFQMLPLIQIAALTGVYGVSFLVVWTSLSLFSAVVIILSKPTMRYAWMSEIILPLTVLLAVFVFGMARLREHDSESPTIRVALVQPSIPQTMIWDVAENTNRFQQVLALSERALTNKADLLIWPEAALPEFNQENYTAITNLIRTHHVWMIFGADDEEERPDATGEKNYYNAAFLFNPDGRWTTTYRKQKLVIFGEYIPLIRWLPFIKFFTPITGGFTAGDKPVPFELERRAPPRRESDAAKRAEPVLGAPARVKASMLICFEDVFPHLVPEYVDDDTDFLVNLTNDGWFGEGAEQRQHAATAVFRAVENGLPLVRCCNNGLTCWIDSRGRLREIFRDEHGSEYGVGAMTVQIPVLAPGEKRVPTFYTKHGDWFGWSCAGIAFVTALVRARQKIAAV
jgi:apolipoprotein N-acyltransferase